MSKLKKAYHFLTKDMWFLSLRGMPHWKAIGIRTLRTTFLSIRNFSKIQLSASSLTYYTLFAIVPFIALLIGIARGFQLEKVIESWLLQQFYDQKEVISKVFQFANRSLQRASGGVIAGVGISMLLWAAIQILMSIEYVMNDIWGVKQGRGFFKRFTDYVFLIFLMPIVILLASGINSYISAALTTLATKSAVFQEVQYLIVPFVELVPLVLTGLLWTFLFIFIPNIKVHFWPALIAGIFTSLLYQGVQAVYVYLQVGVTSYNAIYGTFAALPLFLIWLDISWIIVLFGAQVTYSIQTSRNPGFASGSEIISHKFFRLCTLWIAHFCIKKFYLNEIPPTSEDIAKELPLPVFLIHEVLRRLVDGDILMEVKRKHDKQSAFHPAKSLETLTIKLVIDMMEGRGQEIPLPAS